MKKLLCSSLCFVCIGALISGCGGGGASSSGTNPSNVQILGIWSGSTKASTGLVTGVVSNQYYGSGTTLTGASVIVLSTGQVEVGSISGVISGATCTSTVDYGSFGKTTETLKLSNNSVLSGSYTRKTGTSVAETGTESFTPNIGSSTPDVRGNYTGSAKGNASGSTTTTISVAIPNTLSTNTFDATVTANGTAIAATGAVIGNKMVISVANFGGNNIYISGTIAGTSFTGTYYETAAGGTGAPSSGTVTLTKQ